MRWMQRERPCARRPAARLCPVAFTFVITGFASWTGCRPAEVREAAPASSEPCEFVDLHGELPIEIDGRFGDPVPDGQGGFLLPFSGFVENRGDAPAAQIRIAVLGTFAGGATIHAFHSLVVEGPIPPGGKEEFAGTMRYWDASPPGDRFWFAVWRDVFVDFWESLEYQIKTDEEPRPDTPP